MLLSTEWGQSKQASWTDWHGVTSRQTNIVGSTLRLLQISRVCVGIALYQKPLPVACFYHDTDALRLVSGDCVNGLCHGPKCFNNVASAEFNCLRFEFISERSQSDSSGFWQSRNVSQKFQLCPKCDGQELQCNLSQTRMTFRPSTEICKINYRRLADTSRNHSFAAVKPFRPCVAFHLRWPLSTSRQRYMELRMTFKPRHPDIYPTVSLLSYLLYLLSHKPQIQDGHGKKSDGL